MERTVLGLQYQLERELRPFALAEVQRLPRNQVGVYALWLPTSRALPECLYVGVATTCLRRRLLQHLQQETNPELQRELRLFGPHLQFSAAATQGRAATLELETALIGHWKPRCNRNKLGG